MTTRTTPISPTSTLIVRMLQVCRRLRLLCLDLRTIRSPPSLLVSLRGFSIKTIQNQKSKKKLKISPCSLEQRMWLAGLFWGGEPPPEPPPPDDPGLTAAHWLQPTNWLLEAQYGSPGAGLASHANSNERATNTLQNNNQASPTTAQQASGGLGAQGTTVPARVSDPSPIPHDQPGTLASGKNMGILQNFLVYCRTFF